jgi:hypothetical protein
MVFAAYDTIVRECGFDPRRKPRGDPILLIRSIATTNPCDLDVGPAKPNLVHCHGGAPFVWPGATAQLAIEQLTRSDMDAYPDVRRQKGIRCRPSHHRRP